MRQDRPAARKQTELQPTKMVNPVKLLKVSDLGVHRTRSNGTYLNSNNGRWAPLGILKGTEVTALSSKFARLEQRAKSQSVRIFNGISVTSE